MRHRAPAVILLMAVVFAAPVFVVGQAPSGTKTFEETAINTDAAIKAAVEAAKAAAATTNWTPPRTPWGDPDLQGYYFNHSGYTPLSVPESSQERLSIRKRKPLPRSSRRSRPTRMSTREWFTTTGRNMGWTPGRAASDRTCARR